LTTPGISPFSASARKHKRHTPNFRRKPRGRPHSWHRLCLRQLNFGFRASFTLFAVVAIFPLENSYQLLASSSWLVPFLIKLHAYKTSPNLLSLNCSFYLEKAKG
jgi:hypothetical protein